VWRSGRRLPFPGATRRSSPCPERARHRRPRTSSPRSRARPEPRTAGRRAPTPAGAAVAEQQRGRRCARNEYMPRAGRVQPTRTDHEIRERVARGVALRDELLRAEPQQLDTPLQRGPQLRTGQVGDDQLTLGAPIADQPAVRVPMSVLGEDERRLGPPRRQYRVGAGPQAAARPPARGTGPRPYSASSRSLPSPRPGVDSVAGAAVQVVRRGQGLGGHGAPESGSIPTIASPSHQRSGTAFPRLSTTFTG